MSRRELVVPISAEGERLDHYLASRLGSRAAAVRQIDAGAVTVGGARRPKRHRLRAGERIALELTALPTPTVGPVPADPPGDGAKLAVLFEDAHLLVVDKPAGMVVHPGRGQWAGTLAQRLAGRAAGGSDPGRAGIVHRLDRDTSGLLVVSRSDRVHRALQAELAQRRVRREYLALVDGCPPARTGTIDAPLGRDRRDRTVVSTDTDRPRPARTHFVTERRLPDATLLRVTLETGRTHQIRAHLCAIGHPVSGDPQYGREGRFGLERQFLHAVRLAFEHPITKEPVDVHSELPRDLASALERAGRRDP